MQPHSSGVGSGIPEVQYMQHTSGSTFIRGAVLVYSSGEVAEGGANPTEIVGVALADAGSAPGYNAANSPSPITGRAAKVAVARAAATTVFKATLTNNSSTRIAPAVADIGVQYGLTAYSGVWTVDKNKTGGNARVEVVGIDLDQNYVLFKFLNSAISTD